MAGDGAGCGLQQPAQSGSSLVTATPDPPPPHTLHSQGETRGETGGSVTRVASRPGATAATGFTASCESRHRALNRLPSQGSHRRYLAITPSLRSDVTSRLGRDQENLGRAAAQFHPGSRSHLTAHIATGSPAPDTEPASRSWPPSPAEMCLSFRLPAAPAVLVRPLRELTSGFTCARAEHQDESRMVSPMI